jgi:hypothetical protein
MASPKSRLWWVLWVRGCSWLVLAPKVLQLCINHLVLVFCMFVWIIEACQFFLIPSQSSSTPLYPSKCCELRSGPDSLLFWCFQFGSHIWVTQGVGNTSLWAQSNRQQDILIINILFVTIDYTTKGWSKSLMR